MAKPQVLAVGEPRMALRIRRSLSPWVNFQIERLRYAVETPLLRLVPRRFRSVGPLRRFYWQPAEVEAINRRARQIARDLGWER
jgi:hypothetical protein